MTEHQKRVGAMEIALARWQPHTLSEYEEREILSTIIRHAARIGIGPLTWLFSSAQKLASPLPLPASSGELLACPRCGEKRFQTTHAVNGHLRVCKKGGKP